MGLQITVSTNGFITAVSLWLVTFYNFSFFQQVLQLYPATVKHFPFLAAVFILQSCAIILLISLLSFKYLIKASVMALLLTSALTSYLMDFYGNIPSQDFFDHFQLIGASGLEVMFNTGLLLHLLLLALLPLWIVNRVKLDFQTVLAEFNQRLKLIATAFGLATLVLLIYFNQFQQLYQARNPAGYFSNPLYVISKGIQWMHLSLSSPAKFLHPDTKDAVIVEMDHDRELVIMVVGEAARADRFSINGYHRTTTPLLEQEDVISFQDFSACATTTNESLDCLFTDSDSRSRGNNSVNLLRIMQHTGINVLWRDNNKRVNTLIDGITYEDFRQPGLNPVCDPECRDIGMLQGLQEYIDAHGKGDILIVLHQIGSQGPAYFQRYPPDFEHFSPVCKTGQLINCTQQEIDNAYDNSIRYTDYFLHQTIGLLKRNSNEFETAMVYVSDHGESLGEQGVYLHGLPNSIAPQKQIHVASLMWIHDDYHHADKKTALARLHQPLRHDHIFHTLLNLFEIQTDLYDPTQDILSDVW